MPEYRSPMDKLIHGLAEMWSKNAYAEYVEDYPHLTEEGLYKDAKERLTDFVGNNEHGYETLQELHDGFDLMATAQIVRSYPHFSEWQRDLYRRRFK